MIPARRAWLIAGSILAVTALATGGCQVAGLIGRTTEHRTVTVDESIRRVVVDSDAGRVRVEPAEGDVITITRRAVRSFRTPRFRSRVDGDRLLVSAECPGFLNGYCQMDVTLRVPAGVDLSASSSGGGITVTGGTGRLELDSSGGGVRVVGPRAPVVRAESSGGGVQVDFATAPQSVDVDSSGGGVTVSVSRDETSYSVDASSSGGSTRIQVRTDPAAQPRIKARSSGGGVTVRYHDVDDG